MCPGLGSSEYLGGRDEGLNPSPSDLLKEGPHFLLIFPADDTVPGRWASVDVK